MRKVFTTGQVAKICKVAPRTVSKWFDSGRLKGYRIPGSQDRRIPREQLIKFLRDHGMPLGTLETEERDLLPSILAVGLKVGDIAVFRDVLPDDEFRLEFAASTFEAGGLLSSSLFGVVAIDFGIETATALGLRRDLLTKPRTDGLFAVGILSEDRGGDEPFRTELLQVQKFNAVAARPLDAAELARTLGGYAVYWNEIVYGKADDLAA